MTEIPKGLKLILQMAGITPEMLQNPAFLLRQFGINPDDVTKKVAEFQQIGVRIETAFNTINARMDRIEHALGIVAPDNARRGVGVDDHDSGELSGLGNRPPDRRN